MIAFGDMMIRRARMPSVIGVELLSLIVWRGRAFCSFVLKRHSMLQDEPVHFDAAKPEGLQHAESPLAALLRELAQTSGSPDSRWETLEALYPELRKVALSEMMGQSPQTLQVTALVHEAALRLLSVQNVDWATPRQFFAYVGTLMRHILVDRARRRQLHQNVVREMTVLDEDLERLERSLGVDLDSLNAALDKLKQFDPIGAELIDHYCVLRRSMQATADALGLPLRSAERKWRSVRAWLKLELRGDT